MKRIILSLIAVMMMVQAASAVTINIEPDEWEYSCANDTHLLREATIWFNDTSYYFNQTIECANNCSNITLSCEPDAADVPADVGMIVIILLIAVASMFLLISFGIRDRHPELSLMFFIVPLFVIVSAINFAGMMIHPSSQEAVQRNIFNVMDVTLWMIYLTMIVIVLKLIKTVMEMFFGKEDKGLKEL